MALTGQMALLLKPEGQFLQLSRLQIISSKGILVVKRRLVKSASLLMSFSPGSRRGLNLQQVPLCRSLHVQTATGLKVLIPP